MNGLNATRIVCGICSRGRGPHPGTAWPSRGLVCALVAFSAFAFLAAAAQSAQAAGSPSGSERPSVVAVVFDGVALSDVLGPGMPFLSGAARKGAVGLMNVRTAGRRSDDAGAFATLGAGRRAEGTPGAYLGFGAGEQYLGEDVQNLASRWLGMSLCGMEVVDLGIPELARVNQDSDYGATPGLLGEAIDRAGGKAAVIGNSDTSTALRRHVTTVAMNLSGKVAMGLVGRDVLRADPSLPFGRGIDIDKAVDSAVRFLDQGASLVVVDFGDTARFADEAGQYSDEQRSVLRSQVLQRADEFVRALYEGVIASGHRARFMVLSVATDGDSQERGRILAPAILFGHGVEQGVLTSGTTRRPGLIANIDFAPSVLAWLGLPEETGMVGRPIRVVNAPAGADKGEWLLATERRVASAYLLRTPVLRAFVGYQIVVALFGIACVVFRNRTPAILWAALRGGILTSISMPLGFLLLGPVGPDSQAAYLALIVVFAVVLSLAVWGLARRGTSPVVTIAGLTALALMFDVLRGSPLIKVSLLGYCPVVGARYYGIGNEFAGVLTGAAIAFGTGWMDRCGLGASRDGGKRSLLGAVAFGAWSLAVIATIGHPDLGANFGCTLAAAAGFVVTAVALFSSRKSLFRSLLTVAAALVALTAASIAIDLSGPGEPSHIGQAFRSIMLLGPQEGVRIVARKAAMNLRLLRYTIWTKAFLTSGLVMIGLLVRPKGFMKRFAAAFPGAAKGLYGTMAAGLVALIANDSGVVASATAVMFAAMELLWAASEPEMRQAVSEGVHGLYGASKV